MNVGILLLLGLAALWFLQRLQGAANSSGSGGGWYSGDWNGDEESMSGGKYTYEQLRQLWIANGGDPAKASTAAAVAMAESGGDPFAFNGRDPHGGSFGLWQINGVHGSQRATYDADANARAAIEISRNGENWNPWGAFTNGSWAKFFGMDGEV